MPEATIRDVARLAQLSVATVSRVLNGFEKVSEAARVRVDEAILELGYVPHAGARSLSLARTNAIGVVLPDLHGEFFSEIVRGMDRAASRRGYLLLLSNLHARAEQATVALRAMHGRVDGLIVMAPQLSEKELAAALPRGVPSILINTRYRSLDHPTINLDNFEAVRLVVDHLAAIGRKRLIHIAGPVGNIDADERAEAFSQIATERSVAFETVRGNFDEESGADAVLKLLASDQTFDAVFAANDNMAIGALRALRTHGIGVPGKVAVAGFDDIPLAQHVGLTTVRVHIDELGERALNRLLEAIAGTDGGCDERHSPELLIRSTTISNSPSQ